MGISLLAACLNLIGLMLIAGALEVPRGVEISATAHQNNMSSFRVGVATSSSSSSSDGGTVGVEEPQKIRAENKNNSAGFAYVRVIVPEKKEESTWQKISAGCSECRLLLGLYGSLVFLAALGLDRIGSDGFDWRHGLAIRGGIYGAKHVDGKLSFWVGRSFGIRLLCWASCWVF